MDISVDTAAMQALVTKAIFDGMTEEKREELLQGAIRSLLETPRGDSRNYYGSKVPPLQEAFNRAVETVAMQHATKHLAEDHDFQARIKKLFADVADKLFAEGAAREDMLAAIASAIRGALSKDRY